MGQLQTSISKLIMDNGKDSATGDVFVAQTKPELKSRLGTIIGIIELFSQPDELVDKFFEIINDLETEYYLPPFDNEGGVEKRFEECLQRANRRIHKAINDSMVAIELKNIHAFVGLINRDRIYLSQIGQSNALLFHRKKEYDYLIVDIFAQAGEKPAKINVEKMFSNIINGVITEKDNLFFCNESLLDYVSQNELMNITTTESPMTALKEIEVLLRKENPNNNFYAIAIEPLTNTTDRKIAPLITNEKLGLDDDIIEKHYIPSQNSINKLITTQENTEKYLAPGVSSNWKKAIMIISIGVSIALKFTYKYLKIGLIKLWKIINIIFDYLKVKIPQLVHTIFKIKALNTAGASSPITLTSDTYPPKSDTDDFLTTPYSEINHSHHSNFTAKNQGVMINISHWLNKQIAKFIGLNKLQQILLVVVLILIFFFSQSMVWQGQVKNTTEKTSTTDLVKQIEDSLNAGEAKNIFNDETGSKESLQLAIELMNQIPNSSRYTDVKEKLQRRIDELNKSLQKIAYLENPEVVSDLANQNQAADISTITKSGNFIFAFDNQNQNIYKIDLDKKQTLARQLSSNFTKIRKIIALDENNIIILNGDSELFKYNFEANTAESALAAGDKITDLNIYGGKLYTLKAENNQIYKHFPVDTGYNSGNNWIKDGTTINQVVAFAIDGSVFTINDTGVIQHLLNGNLVTSEFSATTPAITSPRQILSDGETNYLYVLDQNNQRIIVFDKNSGTIKIQYSSKDFTDMKSMALESKDKKIYLLSDKKIYLINDNN